ARRCAAPSSPARARCRCTRPARLPAAPASTVRAGALPHPPGRRRAGTRWPHGTAPRSAPARPASISAALPRTGRGPDRRGGCTRSPRPLAAVPPGTSSPRSSHALRWPTVQSRNLLQARDQCPWPHRLSQRETVQRIGVLACLVAALSAQQPVGQFVASGGAVGETLGTYSREGDLVQIVEGLTGALPSTVAGTTQQVRSPRPRPCPDLALRQPLGQ